MNIRQLLVIMKSSFKERVWISEIKIVDCYSGGNFSIKLYMFGFIMNPQYALINFSNSIGD